MQNQNEQQMYQDSTQMQPEQNHGGHSLFDTDEAIGDLIGAMEQYLLYEEHIQDQSLTAMAERHQLFLTQLYNTIIDSLKTGQDPTVPTQIYNMEQTNDIIYGTQPKAPKIPNQSVNEISDECVSGFILGNLKAVASSFTMTSLEVTNPVLRRIFADSIPNIIEMAYEVFLYQNKHHYYQVPQLKPQDMEAIQNGFAPAQTNMPH